MKKTKGEVWMRFRTTKAGYYVLKEYGTDFFSEWDVENKVIEKAIQKFIKEIRKHAEVIEKDREELAALDEENK